MLQLHGKSVVVTGAGRGIGEAYARGAASLGAAVIVNDLDLTSAAEVAADIRGRGGRAVAHGANVAVSAEAGEVIATCVREYGGIDGLVNNASLLRLNRLEAATESEFRDMIEANVLGTFNCAAHAIRVMYAQKRGSIINVVSGAQVGMAALGCYGATKGAVASLTYAWAAEAAGSGVRVNAISPMASTRMMIATNDYYAARGAIPAGPQTIPPEANVPVVTFLLSDQASAVNGQVIRITGGQLSLMTHPAIRTPILERDLWTAEAVSEAFSNSLAALQLPLGLGILEVHAIRATAT